MSPISEKIKARLIELRKTHNFSQVYVATFCGLTSGTYQHYEVGRAEPSVATLYKLAELYCFSGIDELINGSEKTQPLLIDSYISLPLEKRKIVDFILQLHTC
jgi:transcriptional regulator with XRE-family HTH domain